MNPTDSIAPSAPRALIPQEALGFLRAVSPQKKLRVIKKKIGHVVEWLNTVVLKMITPKES
jgi:hypothetical protein